ncbi:MAG: hypothetical protein JJT89_15085 [Nitriliruptoraceae bacterium]|nr:hypothetical protein [Nitriliruptoraceae bacterium]
MTDVDPMHVLHLDQRTRFAQPPEVVWDFMSRTERFPHWWRWLRDFDDGGAGLISGGALSGLVVPPIPYRFRVTIQLDEVVAGQSIRATLAEDLAGPAELELFPVGQGTELAIRWDVEMRKPAMRSAARFARPLLVWGHDQVIDITLRRFERVVAGPA